MTWPPKNSPLGFRSLGLRGLSWDKENGNYYIIAGYI